MEVGEEEGRGEEKGYRIIAEESRRSTTEVSVV